MLILIIAFTVNVLLTMGLVMYTIHTLSLLDDQLATLRRRMRYLEEQEQNMKGGEHV